MEHLLIIKKVYELVEIIKDQDDYNTYIKYDIIALEDPILQGLINNFQRKKISFEEALRYKDYYPDFDKVKNEYQQAKIELMNNEIFKEYKQLEKEVDLYVYKIENSLKEVLNIKEKHGNKAIKFL